MAEYDVVIRGGTIVDGTGIPPYRADLAVKDGRVAMIRRSDQSRRRPGDRRQGVQRGARRH